ncbi:MAG: zinc ribbon domain-containing protein [Caldivirga sp.]
MASPSRCCVYFNCNYFVVDRAVISKALEYGVPVVIVNPRGTSSVCSICGGKLTYVHRLAICMKYSFIADRDTVGAMNIWLRALQTLHAHAGVPWSPPRAPVNDEARGRGRRKRKGMKKINTTIHI